MEKTRTAAAAASHPIPVRIPRHLKRRLERAAKRMGSTVSGVVKFSILQQLPAIEAGHVELVKNGQ